jgi:O-antigen/teichoic acid export membrane protein
MAFDKNISALFTQVPLTLVGIFGGNTAAGYLGSALDLINRSDIITGPILENMQAIVPLSVGRGDFLGLRRNFTRVMFAMTAAGVSFYAVVALAAPLFVPLLLGPGSQPAVPVVVILCFYGAIIAVGGIFGPLYRALDLMRPALVVKIVTVLIVVPIGIVLIQQLGPSGGAWMIVGLYGLSVALTAIISLPPMRRRAEVQQNA